MKTNWFVAAGAVLWGVAATALGQSANLHRFSAIDLKPDQTISLTLTSSVPSSLRNYYDLFPIEASQNLVDWEPLATLVRTNTSTNGVLMVDLAATNHANRFYRTPTNQLITPIPRPSGPYAVGTVSRLFTDPSRTNRYNISTNSGFMVQFWYPAEPRAGVLPAPYLDPRIAVAWYGSYDSGANLLLFKSAVSHALPLVPIATNQAPFPVLIFSHGYKCLRTMDTDVMESLASHGYITVAIDHADAWVSIFPSGQIVRGDAPELPISLALNAVFLQGRTSDVRFVLDELTRLDQEDDFFRNRFDLQHVGIFGHSFGGAIAADACAADNRFRVGLSLDGGGHTNLLGLSIAQPFLIASGDDDNPVMPLFRAAFRSLFDQLAHDAYWFRLKNSDHFDFVESPWFALSPVPAKLRTATVLRAYILSFFNKYLKGQDDHFLDEAPADWPEVDVFLKK